MIIHSLDGTVEEVSRQLTSHSFKLVAQAENLDSNFYIHVPMSNSLANSVDSPSEIYRKDICFFPFSLQLPWFYTPLLRHELILRLLNCFLLPLLPSCNLFSTWAKNELLKNPTAYSVNIYQAPIYSGIGIWDRQGQYLYAAHI